MRAVSLTATIISSVLLFTGGTPAITAKHHKHHKHKKHGICHTHACDVRVQHKREKRYLAHTAITSFDLCVANRENGEPGATSFNTVNWHANNNYEGAFSWEHSKWVAGGGLRFADHPYDATPLQQVAVFHQNGRNGEWTSNNWPTIPPCIGHSGGP